MQAVFVQAGLIHSQGVTQRASPSPPVSPKGRWHAVESSTADSSTSACHRTFPLPPSTTTTWEMCGSAKCDECKAELARKSAQMLTTKEKRTVLSTLLIARETGEDPHLAVRQACQEYKINDQHAQLYIRGLCDEGILRGQVRNLGQGYIQVVKVEPVQPYADSRLEELEKEDETEG